jgi:hypothetical protein
MMENIPGGFSATCTNFFQRMSSPSSASKQTQ